MLKNSADTYGLVSRAFHWVIALLILCLIPVGFWMEGLPYSPLKGSVYGLHKAFGITVLTLALLRVIWSVILNPRPEPLESHALWERILAGLIHILLYIGMIGMPLSGWVMSSAGEHAVPFFGLFNLPSIVPKNETVFEIAGGVHTAAGYALLAAVGLHFAGAIKHHLIDRDGTLRRMGGNMIFAGLGLVLLLTAAGVIASNILRPEAEVQTEGVAAQSSAQDALSPSVEGVWAIDHAQSKIGFRFTQYGQAVEGAFTGFDGVIRFDPADLAGSSAQISINTASISTGDTGRDDQARGGDWFDHAAFPDIKFTSAAFSHQGGNAYTVQGSLTIRGISKDITFPFTLDIEGNKALMKADLTLSRLDFGVGQGEWAGTEAIGGDVKISLILQASRG